MSSNLYKYIDIHVERAHGSIIMYWAFLNSLVLACRSSATKNEWTAAAAVCRCRPAQQPISKQQQEAIPGSVPRAFGEVLLQLPHLDARSAAEILCTMSYLYRSVEYRGCTVILKKKRWKDW